MRRGAKREHSIAQVIAARREKLRLRQDYCHLLIRALILALLLHVILTHVFLITQVNGMGMFPSLKDGDLVIAFRLQQEYRKGDVVAYQAGGIRHIGRIAAQGSDVVTIDETGTLLVNGTLQDSDILYPTYPGDSLEYPYRVPPEAMFVLGDYRTQTKDSRDYGPILITDVEGKVLTILRRRGL